jgi:hypothetical protein
MRGGMQQAGEGEEARPLGRAGSTKLQAPSSREISSIKHQTGAYVPRPFWNLELGISLELGAWSLVLPARLRLGWSFELPPLA